MTVKYHQISLKDSFSDCQDMFINDTPAFFQLLEAHMDLDDFIPPELYHVSIRPWAENVFSHFPVFFLLSFCKKSSPSRLTHY